MFEIIKKDITDNVIGNENKIEIALASIISGGHILIEDLPITLLILFLSSMIIKTIWIIHNIILILSI